MVHSHRPKPTLPKGVQHLMEINVGVVGVDPGFPVGGGRQPTILPKISKKLHEIE